MATNYSAGSSSESTPLLKASVTVSTHEVEDVDENALAPVENTNPLGKEVTLLTAFMLNIGQITGSGIYAVPGVILNSVGSIGLLLTYWVITPLFAFGGLMLYSELASMFPNRSGAEVVYLEQAYPRPRFFVSTSFAVIAILTSFSASNAIVFAQYFLTALQIPITDVSQTVTALAVVFVTVGSVGVSTKGSLRAVNILTFFKVVSLCFIVVSGFAVLAGLTRVTDPWDSFKKPFEGSTSNANALATAFVKTNTPLSAGTTRSTSSGKSRAETLSGPCAKRAFLSLSATSVLFFFINVAYVAAVPAEEIRNSGQLVAVLFFQRVFGDSFSAKLFPLLVALSCFGNIARVIREVGRQGLLPYPTFFASTKPFGTPLGPVALKGFLTFIVILAVPARDTFNFVLDLASYPHLIFQIAMVVGVWILRKRNAKKNLPPSSLQTHNFYIILYLASAILLLVLPWVPPEPGHADVSFWYATYCVAGLGLIAACGVYYVIWVVVLPKLGGYDIVEEVKGLEGGAKTTRLVRRYKLPREEEN
ncbi:amino acid transporter [Ephemerocybe angulata]|uniref:Amino acid transporter n=1 Tax=Ephemerocybe angulata TaxID=980116 RepID=A0A8H6M664_9AGAR|nr:amino acid transporter [Tulosesus angulatus]